VHQNLKWRLGKSADRTQRELANRKLLPSLRKFLKVRGCSWKSQNLTTEQGPISCSSTASRFCRKRRPRCEDERNSSLLSPTGSSATSRIFTPRLHSFLPFARRWQLLPTFVRSLPPTPHSFTSFTALSIRESVRYQVETSNHSNVELFQISRIY
jgi:hypothetical protein